jgi:hypothetical protein
MIDIPLDLANRWVLQKQHLTPATRGQDIVQVVDDVGGLHATRVTTPYLSLFARVVGFSRDDLDRELYQRHTVGKIRCVRKTIYIHTRAMMPVAWRATEAAILPLSRRFMEARGVSGAQYTVLAGRIQQLLRGREMAAAEIRAALSSEADLSPVLYFLCDQGVLVRGRPVASWKDRRQTYALFWEWFPDVELRALTEAEAVAALVLHYLAALGPTSEDDVVWWTGLGKRAVRRALESLADAWCWVRVPEMEAHMLCLQADLPQIEEVAPWDEPVVSLLPVLDSYCMGYKARARYLEPTDAEYVFDRSGNATSTFLVNGRVAGVWDVQEEPPTVLLFSFRSLEPEAWRRVEAAARTTGRFVTGREVRLQVCDTMVPLTRRSAGHVMAPLKRSG